MYKQIQSKLILVQDSAMSSKWGLLGVTCTWTCFSLFITVLLRESWNNFSTLFVDILFHIICWHTVFHLLCGTASVRSYGYITRRWNNTFCLGKGSIPASNLSVYKCAVFCACCRFWNSTRLVVLPQFLFMLLQDHHL